MWLGVSLRDVTWYEGSRLVGSELHPETFFFFNFGQSATLISSWGLDKGK